LQHERTSRQLSARRRRRQLPLTAVSAPRAARAAQEYDFVAGLFRDTRALQWHVADAEAHATAEDAATLARQADEVEAALRARERAAARKAAKAAKAAAKAAKAAAQRAQVGTRSSARLAAPRAPTPTPTPSAAAAAAPKPKASAARRRAAAAPPAPAREKQETGRRVPWTPEQDDDLHAAVAARGRGWEDIRDDVATHALFPALRTRLGAPQSKCLRKRWDKLAKWAADGVPVRYIVVRRG
jgi:hypothetical protein